MTEEPAMGSAEQAHQEISINHAKEAVMSHIAVTRDQDIVTVTLCRGKVNAMNEAMVEELAACFGTIEADETLRAVILTGEGSFFSFGFDIPEFLSYPKEAFTRYLLKFTGLYTYLFTFPKPIIAALNGHTVAGGCMLATACDYRLMVSGKAKIALNEINFGASVFAGSVALLEYCVGSHNAQKILFSGRMLGADEAMGLGLVDRVTTSEDLPHEALRVAQDYASKDASAFREIKNLLRKPVTEAIMKSEEASIQAFVNIWYSENTWKNLQAIKIG
jgi:Delta3-Delta2-enoyl-CoA isomerase